MGLPFSSNQEDGFLIPLIVYAIITEVRMAIKQFTCNIINTFHVDFSYDVKHSYETEISIGNWLLEYCKWRDVMEWEVIKSNHELIEAYPSLKCFRTNGKWVSSSYSKYLQFPLAKMIKKTLTKLLMSTFLDCLYASNRINKQKYNRFCQTRQMHWWTDTS